MYIFSYLENYMCSNTAYHSLFIMWVYLVRIQHVNSNYTMFELYLFCSYQFHNTCMIIICVFIYFLFSIIKCILSFKWEPFTCVNCWLFWDLHRSRNTFHSLLSIHEGWTYLNIWQAHSLERTVNARLVS